MTFDQAFERTLGHEGGYVNDTRDPGGATKYGISARAYPDEDIAGMTIGRAKSIYRRDYWDRCHCDQLPDWMAFQVFDAAVHSSVKQATLWLQRAVGASQDGIIGARTIAATRQAEPAAAVARFNAHRLQFLTERKTWSAHGKGWARRIAANLMEA